MPANEVDISSVHFGVETLYDSSELSGSDLRAGNSVVSWLRSPMVGRRLRHLFLEMRRGTRRWDDRFAELETRDFNREDLPTIEGEKVHHCFQDHRDLVFLRAHPKAYHGASRELEMIGVDAAGDVLRSLFRFGAPIEDGFHHDVQFTGGKRLKNEAFDCGKRGEILVSASHANIYANDYVRAYKITTKNR